MKFDLPWSVKGIRPEARETAQEAARRAGLPLGDWLNAIILQQAATQGVRGPSFNRHGDEGISGYFSNVHRPPDDLKGRIGQVTHSGPVACALRRGREESDQSGELPRRATATAAPVSGPVPAQDLSGLEAQLRQITNQIEMLRRPGVEGAVTSLRAELGEIGRTLNEAMPRRAIETIENQVQGLNQRVVEGRQAGVDNNALAGIEHGLAEVRDALRGLMPAENLVGYTEAIDALAHKIDLIVVQKDPATLQQLESSIRTLREMATHIASDETVTGLSTQVQALADKIDHLAIGAGVGEALNKLELRIDALSRAMAERAQNGDTQLEALIQSLSDKIEQIQQSRGDQIELGHFEDCIAKLAERLNATDSRLSHLSAIERGLADLLIHIEDIRANKEAAGFRAESVPGINLLKQDMARTQDTLEAVHGTLDRVTALSANDFFNNAQSKPKPPFSFTRWGGSLGGPAYVPKLYDGKNRSFFMWGYEGWRDARPRHDDHDNGRRRAISDRRPHRTGDHRRGEARVRERGVRRVQRRPHSRLRPPPRASDRCRHDAGRDHLGRR